MSSFTGVVGAVIAPSKVISGLEFAHHLHLTNKGDPGNLEILLYIIFENGFVPTCNDLLGASCVQFGLTRSHLPFTMVCVAKGGMNMGMEKSG